MRRRTVVNLGMPNVMPKAFTMRLRPELDPMYPMHRNEE